MLSGKRLGCLPLVLGSAESQREEKLFGKTSLIGHDCDAEGVHGIVSLLRAGGSV
jgi:hypothetical protein